MQLLCHHLTLNTLASAMLSFLYFSFFFCYCVKGFVYYAFLKTKIKRWCLIVRQDKFLFILVEKSIKQVNLKENKFGCTVHMIQLITLCQRMILQIEYIFVIYLLHLFSRKKLGLVTSNFLEKLSNNKFQVMSNLFLVLWWKKDFRNDDCNDNDNSNNECFLNVILANIMLCQPVVFLRKINVEILRY